MRKWRSVRTRILPPRFRRKPATDAKLLVHTCHTHHATVHDACENMWTSFEICEEITAPPSTAFRLGDFNIFQSCSLQASVFQFHWAAWKGYSPCIPCSTWQCYTMLKVWMDIQSNLDLYGFVRETGGPCLICSESQSHCFRLFSLHDLWTRSICLWKDQTTAFSWQWVLLGPKQLKRQERLDGRALQCTDQII